MSDSIQQVENDMAAYKVALKEINIEEKERIENKYPVTSKYKEGIPQSSVDVMIDVILKIDSNHNVSN